MSIYITHLVDHKYIQFTMSFFFALYCVFTFYFGEFSFSLLLSYYPFFLLYILY